MKVSPSLTMGFSALAFAGAVAFVVGVLGASPLRTWQAYLVNFLFWIGMASGALCLLAVLNITGSKWGRPLKRLAESFGIFLPIAFILYFILYYGRTFLFPWIASPVEARQAWLNVPFFFARGGMGLFLLAIIGLAMIRASLKSDELWTESSRGAPSGDKETPCLRDWRKQQVLSPFYTLIFALVLSLIAFDLVMSLDPRWYSTLLGGYFFIGSFYTGVAAVFLVSLFTCRTNGLRDHVGPRHFHDLGKLLLSFSLFTGYLFYAQFLVIWYGNLPVETRYVILRVKTTPWEYIAWPVLFMIFTIPFGVLLGRRIKTKRTAMIIISLLVLAGMWLERFILIAPSLWMEKGIPLGWTEALITAGYLGIVGLCVTQFLKRVPLLPLSDPLFAESLKTDKELLEP
jgi:Ni/Fe-hydrogenase subunit HybB-like protein